MAKNLTGRELSSSSQANERNLASQKKGVTALLDKTISLDFNSSPDLSYSDTLQDTLFPETPIVSALEKYLESPTVNLHIPAHGAEIGILPKFKELIGAKAVKADTTDDFDGLGQLLPPSGVIKEAQDIAAKTFGAKHTFFLINGSTVGNLALAMTVTRPGQKIVVARNCHRSVISGLSISGAVPIWVMPERKEEWGIWGKVNPAQIETLLKEDKEITAVWLTNPTYEGVISDIEAISKICKKYNVLLLVDEAHGSHWVFNDELPKSAIEYGADAVVHSIHKTSGSFSQSSMLHLSHNSMIDYEDMLANLKMLQSTSPSYLLLASLDAARAYLDSSIGRERLDTVIKNANAIRANINNIDGCRCLDESSGVKIDPTKLYVMMEGLTGKQLKDILEYEFHIETEARTDDGILALANIGNNEKELEYFYEAIKNIATRKHIYYKEGSEIIKYMPFSIPEMVQTPREAYFAKKEAIPVIDSVGRITTEVVAICPPGIPVLMPGERIQDEHLPYLVGKKTIKVVVE